MARIAGVNIPTDKRVHIALTYIHGIGNTKAKEITTALGIDEMSRVNQLSDDQVVAIRPLYSANAPQASVEIKGGAQPYEGLDIFVGDNDAVRRVGDALEFMRQSCDPSAKTGF